jgi:hypothetical protein
MPPVQPRKLQVFGYRGIATEEPLAILHDGFSAKRDAVTGDPMNMYYLSKLEEAAPGAGDMYSGSANCVASNLSSAALFPNDTSVKVSWIYGVYVEDGFNTYEQQQMDCWDVLLNLKPEVYGTEQMPLVTWPLFAEEFAAVSIPSKHIVACVKCERIWSGADWKLGGTFKLKKPIFWNVTVDANIPHLSEFKQRMTKRVDETLNGNLPMTPG